MALKRPKWRAVFSLTAFSFPRPVAAAASRGRAGPHHPGVPVLDLATEGREGCLLLTLCCWSPGVRKDSGPGQDSDPSLGSVSCDWLQAVSAEVAMRGHRGRGAFSGHRDAGRARHHCPGWRLTLAWKREPGAHPALLPRS